MLPNFLIIGARKAGTTSLYQYLRDHSQVFMSHKKELNFFEAEFNGSRGLRWYEQHFEGAGDAIAVGEASPSYTRYPYSRGVPARIAEVLPEARLIYLVRHPLERMTSSYLQNTRAGRGREPSIEKALLTNPRYVDVSRYAMQIEQYLPYFPRERLLIVKSEDLRDARGPTMERVFGFLGVDRTWVPGNLEEEYNTTRSKKTRAVRPAARAISRTLRLVPGYKALASAAPPGLKEAKRRVATRDIDPTITIPDGVRQELEERLRPDVQRLRTYMGDEFDGWGIG